MNKVINKMVLSAGVLLALNANSQTTVLDNLNWAATTAQTSETSPDFEFCNGEVINYTMSTPSNGNFTNVSASGNASLVNGVIFPANTGGTSTSQIEIVLTFSQPITNLRIGILDLDGVEDAETVTGIAPNYSSLVSSVGTLLDPLAGMVGEATSVNAAADNAAGSIVWSGIAPTTSFTIFYNRPGNGYGLIIDEVEFSCEDDMSEGCICNAKVQGASFSNADVSGAQTSVLGINTMGELVSSVTIELPFYVSDVDDNCFKCDLVDQESFGTIRSASTIAGTSGVLYDPLGLGYSRKLVYNFTTPVAVNESVTLGLQFPPVLELSCCKNKVRFCLDVTLKKEDCSTCEYTVCNSENNGKVVKEKSKQTFQDGPVIMDGNEVKSLDISPNPASDFLQISVVNRDLIGQTGVMTNTSGVIVKSFKMDEKNTRVNVEYLATGMYLLKVQSDKMVESYNVVIK